VSFYYVILITVTVQKKGMENQNTEKKEEEDSGKTFLYWSGEYFKGLLD